MSSTARTSVQKMESKFLRGLSEFVAYRVISDARISREGDSTKLDLLFSIRHRNDEVSN